MAVESASGIASIRCALAASLAQGRRVQSNTSTRVERPKARERGGVVRRVTFRSSADCLTGRQQLSALVASRCRSGKMASRNGNGSVSMVAASEAKPTILVSEKLGEAGLDMLRQHANVDCSYDLTPEELCAKISLVDALIVRSGTKVTKQVFEAARGRLKVVGRAGVGIDNVDLVAATETGCLVVNAPTANTVAAAEHGIALLTALSRNVAQADASMKAGRWERSKWTGVSVVDKTLVVFGFGKVGAEVARRGKGLGMRVLAFDPYAPADKARALGVELVAFDEALKQGDFFSLHMPLTPTTDKLFNDDVFAKMKKGARLINVARGGVVDEAALVRALDNKIVVGAALDVFTVEPPPKDHPLVNRPDVICTPHLGASTVEAQEGVAVEIAEAVIGALQGELASTAVNAPMVPKEVLAQLSPYVTLAERLGQIGLQLIKGAGIKDVRITYSAPEPDELDTRLLRAMVIKGLVEPVSNSRINLVNADFIAKQRGIRISELKEQHEADPNLLLRSIGIQLEAESNFAAAAPDGKTITFEGRVKEGVPYLTRVGHFAVDISLEGSALLYRQVDQPGMIGKVGTILGDDNCNISFMSVGRTGARQQAVMAIGVDEMPSETALAAIGALPAIEEWLFLRKY